MRLSKIILKVLNAGFKIEDTLKLWLTISWSVLQKQDKHLTRLIKGVIVYCLFLPLGVVTPNQKMLMILSKNILYFYMPRNKLRIYLQLLLLFHSAQVLVLESIWLGLKYTLFYVNVDHLVVTKEDVRLVLMLTIQTVFRVFLQRRVTK